MPAYEVTTIIGGDTTVHKFVTENVNMVNEYVEDVLRKYYKKIVIENKENDVRYTWSSSYTSKSTTPPTEDDFVLCGKDHFINAGHLYLKLVSYSSVKRMYTIFSNNARSRIKDNGYYYHYRFGKLSKYSDIPKFETYYQYCIDNSIGCSFISISLITHINESWDVLDQVDKKISAKNYTCPEWCKELKTKIKIEDLMHRAYLRRCQSLSDKTNTDT